MNARLQEQKRLLDKLVSTYIAKHPEQKEEVTTFAQEVWRRLYAPYKGGSKSSQPRIENARLNGLKGGRPKKEST